MTLRKYLIIATLVLAGAIISLPILTTDAHTDQVSLTIPEPPRFTKVTSRADEQANLEAQVKHEVDLLSRYSWDIPTISAIFIAEGIEINEDSVKLAWYIYKRWGYKAWQSYSSGVYKELL